MKKINNILCYIICTIMFFALTACNNVEQEKKELNEITDFVLDVEKGRDVKILQLSDIQIIDSSQMRTPTRLNAGSITNWAPERMEEVAFKFVRQVVERVQPDLIVLSGDNMYGEFDDNGTVLQALISFIDSFKIPWTLCYGNHDNESIKGVVWQSEQYINAEYCMFKRNNDIVDGNGNFTVGITQGGELVQVVYLMDSHGCVASDSEEGVFTTPGIYENQIEWFDNISKNLVEYNDNKPVKSIGFSHHPLRAIGDGLQKYGYTSLRHNFYDADENAIKFSSVTIPPNNDGDFGTMLKDAGQLIDSDYSFFNLLKQYGVNGWFFCHDHENAISVMHEGVRLTYGLKSSQYDSYSRDLIGGTQITVGKYAFEVENVYYNY